MQKRSTKISNRVIMVVLVLTVTVAVLGTFLSLLNLTPGYSKVTGAASANAPPNLDSKVECENNQTALPEYVDSKVK